MPLLLSQQRRHYADPGNYVKVERDTVHEGIKVKTKQDQVNFLYSAHPVVIRIVLKLK